ncbi:MAG: hypothetical protein JNJ59_22105 [Deltaproteobacteria bacterium]|nr:hypothetical protein [Deltaproteobacteria bacterium]
MPDLTQRPVEEEQNEAQSEAEASSESAALESGSEEEQVSEDGFFTKVKNFFTGKGKEKKKGGDKGKVKEDEAPKVETPKEPEKTPDEILTELLKAGSGELKGLWEKATAGQRDAVATLIKTKDVGNDTLKTLFDATPGGELKVQTLLFEKRFDVSVSETLTAGKTKKAWDSEGIKRCWTVLEKLPEEHVKGNAWLEAWTRYDGGGTGAGGFYAAGKKESAVTYDKDHIDDKNTAAQVGDPLYNVVRFDKVVRHEVGHAVDKQHGVSAALCLGNATGGNWEEHGAPSADLVDKMITAGSTKIKTLSDEHKALVATAILNAMKAGKPADTAKNIKALDIFKSPDGTAPAALDQSVLDAVLLDPVVQTSEKCGADKSPWYKLGNLGIDLGGRHYQVDYGKTWVSYDKAALAKKVSTYQFRAPGEWFAEAYATYFQPDGDGKVGTLLEGRDPTTKEWIDSNILPKEKKETPKEAEGKEPKKGETTTDKGGDKGG